MSFSTVPRRPLPSSRARLALPFVLTAATACTVKSADEPTAAPKAAEAEATPVIVSNPPRPQPTSAPADGKDPRTAAPEPSGATATPAEPVIMRNPPPPGKPVGNQGGGQDAKDPASKVKPTDTAKELPKAPATGGHVQVRADGSCWWTAATKCPPKTACNPPPPKQVQCEADTKKPSKGPANAKKAPAPKAEKTK